MSKNDLTIDIIKLGGSVISKKDKYATLNEKALDQLISELKFMKRQSIIVHGAGSFGHILAKRYNINAGVKEDIKQLKAFLTLKRDMLNLSKTIVTKLNENGIKAVFFQASSLIYSNKEKSVIQIFAQPIIKALELGIIPVLAGDAIFDEKLGFTIYGGDQLITQLVKRFNVAKVIFCTDVDGIWVKDEHDEPFLLKNINRNDISKIRLYEFKNENKIDVTGEMYGKIKEIKQIISCVKEVIILNGLIKGRLKNVLDDIDEIRTRITR